MSSNRHVRIPGNHVAQRLICGFCDSDSWPNENPPHAITIIHNAEIRPRTHQTLPVIASPGDVKRFG